MAIAVYVRMYGDLITNKRYLKEEERERGWGRQGREGERKEGKRNEGWWVRGDGGRR